MFKIYLARLTDVMIYLENNFDKKALFVLKGRLNLNRVGNLLKRAAKN